MTDDQPDRDLIDWVKASAKEGANALHARAATTKPPQLTDAQSAAIARAKLERRPDERRRRTAL